MSVRLYMDQARGIERVCRAWQAGRISASKARGLIEQIALDGVDIETVNPLELGGSETDAVVWAVKRAPYGIDPAQVAEATGLPRLRAAQLLSKARARGLVSRVDFGFYGRAR